MVDRSQSVVRLEAEVREILGDRASEWLVRPSKLLDGLTPAEVAKTPAGKRVVLHELKRTSKPLREAMTTKRV
jgi:uncharacterized protein (DUF2384 family)